MRTDVHNLKLDSNSKSHYTKDITQFKRVATLPREIYSTFLTHSGQWLGFSRHAAVSADRRVAKIVLSDTQEGWSEAESLLSSFLDINIILIRLPFTLRA